MEMLSIIHFPELSHNMTLKYKIKNWDSTFVPAI